MLTHWTHALPAGTRRDDPVFITSKRRRSYHRADFGPVLARLQGYLVMNENKEIAWFVSNFLINPDKIYFTANSQLAFFKYSTKIFPVIIFLSNRKLFIRSKLITKYNIANTDLDAMGAMAIDGGKFPSRVHAQISSTYNLRTIVSPKSFPPPNLYNFSSEYPSWVRFRNWPHPCLT